MGGCPWSEAGQVRGCALPLPSVVPLGSALPEASYTGPIPGEKAGQVLASLRFSSPHPTLCLPSCLKG